MLLVSESVSIATLDLAAFFEAFSSYNHVDCALFDSLDGSYRDDYDVIGYSYFTFVAPLSKQYAILCERLTLLRRRFIGAKLWVGGVGLEVLSPDELLKLSKLADRVCVGAGEQMADLYGDRPLDLSDYPIWSARHVGQQMSAMRKGDVPCVMSARGCPYACNFCRNRTSGIKFFSPKRTAVNMKLIWDYRRGFPYIADDIFSFDGDRMRQLRHELDALQIPYSGRMRFLTRVGYHNEDAIAEFNPCEVQIGLESGDDRMLEAMNKRNTVADNREAVYALAKAVPGKLVGLFMIGYPGETVESLDNTLKFIEETESCYRYIWVSYFYPVPGTPAMEQAKRCGTILDQPLSNRYIGYIDNNLSESVLRGYSDMMFKAVPRSRFTKSEAPQP